MTNEVNIDRARKRKARVVKTVPMSFFSRLCGGIVFYELYSYLLHRRCTEVMFSSLFVYLSASGISQKVCAQIWTTLGGQVGCVITKLGGG